jgi:uncharacterized lipoprotein
MADAPSPEARRRFVRLTAFEAQVAEPTILVEVKRLVAEVDALDIEAQADLAGELSQDWGRLFRGCEADKNRARYSIYKRSSAQLQALQVELDALVNP